MCSIAQPYLTHCDPMDCSPPGSSLHRIFQARILEWVAISSSGDLPDPGIKPLSPASPALQADSLLLSHPQNGEDSNEQRVTRVGSQDMLKK